MFREDFSRQRRARTRQRQIADEIRYRQSMRQIDGGKRRIQALIEDYSTRAAVAERDGQHSRAVRLALEAHRLKKYLASSGDISATLESARAVTAANRALADILDASGGLTNQAVRMADPAALGEAWAGVLSVGEHMRLMLEQSDMLLEDMDGDCPDEAGDALLQEIMRTESRERHDRLMRDTNRQLDRLQRARTEEK